MWLERLEAALVERFGDFEEEHGDWVTVPEVWAKAPWCYAAYGPRQGCLGDNSPFYCGEELLLDIGWMFRFVLDLIAREFDDRAFSVVDSSYEDTSILAIVSGDHRRCLYLSYMKAWHFQFGTPKELEDELVDIAATVLVRLEESGMPVKSVAKEGGSGACPCSC